MKNLIIVALTSGFIGAIVTALFGLWRDRLTRQADKERHIRELAVKAAIEQWKMERSRADAFNDSLPEGSSIEKKTVKSLRLRIATFLKFSEVVTNKDVTAESISKNFIASETIVREAEKEIKNDSEQTHIT